MLNLAWGVTPHMKKRSEGNFAVVFSMQTCKSNAGVMGDYGAEI